jgi:hypothetical protein
MNKIRRGVGINRMEGTFVHVKVFRELSGHKGSKSYGKYITINVATT